MASSNMPRNIFTTVPDQRDITLKPGQLSSEQIRQFFDQGYLILHDYLDTEKDLDPCLKDIEVLVEALAQKLSKAGKIKDLHSDADVYHRLSLLEEEFPGALILLHKSGILPESFRRLWTNEKLLGIMEQLVGPNVGGNPVWNLRTKVPNAEAGAVPWHQDSSYFDDETTNVLCVTAWIPLLDANEKNGTLQILPRGHRPGKLAKHYGCYGDGWQITIQPDEFKDALGVSESEAITCNIKYGGLVIFTNMTPHRGLENSSDVIRWALDLRWQDCMKPWAFHGLKNGIVFRTKESPNLSPDWDSFCAIDRTNVQDAVTRADKEAESSKDEFDTIITGPWMGRWPILHENRHTRHFAKMQKHI